MMTVLSDARSVLRGERVLAGAAGALPQVLRLTAVIVVFGIAYGSIMGTFSATSMERLVQIVYSAVKVPLMLVVTFLISLPSFFVLNTLMGLRRDFADAMRALTTAQAGLTIVLASLAPLTGLWYASCADYPTAILFNAAMFAIASFSAQFVLRRLYQPLIERNPRHRVLLRLWLVTYIFVGIQMGWVLRPFVGAPTSPPRFFREGAFSNAYVYVSELIWNVLTR